MGGKGTERFRKYSIAVEEWAQVEFPNAGSRGPQKDTGQAPGDDYECVE